MTITLKYQQVAESIKQKISQQELAQGTQLPNLNELIASYGVSKSTITKALAILEQQGVIYQVQGSGIFVRKPKRAGFLSILENQGFTSLLDEFHITSKVVKVAEITANEDVAAHLHCSVDDEIYYVERLRYIDGKILGLEHSYYKKSVVPYLNEEIARNSIFHYLKTALKIQIGFSDKYLHISLLDGSTAALLELSENAPALVMEEVYYLTSGEPFDFSRIVYHYQHSQFFIQSSGGY